MSQDSQSRKWQITVNNPADKGITHEVIKNKLQEIKSIDYIFPAPPKVPAWVKEAEEAEQMVFRGTKKH